MHAVRRPMGRGRRGRARRRTGSRCACWRRASARSATSSTPRTTSWSSSASRSTRSMPPRWRGTGRAGRACRSGSRGQGERLATLDHVDRELDAETLLIADASGPLAIAGRDGRRVVGGLRRDARRHRRVRDLRSGERPSDRVPLRAPVGGEPALREGPGVPARTAGRGSRRAAASPSGPADPWRAAASTRSRTSPSRSASRSARRGSIGCSARDLGAEGQREVLARVGHRDGSRAAGRPRSSIGRPEGGRARGPRPRRRARRFSRPCRRGAATSRSRRTWPRRSPASTATRTCRPASRRRRCPTGASRRSPPATRSARRSSGASLTEAVTYALVSEPGTSRSFGWTVADRVGRPARRGARARRSASRTRSRRTTRSFASRSSGSLVEVVGGNARHGTGNVAVFEVGKGYGRVGDAAREWWRLGLALAGSFEEPAWNRPRREADIDDAKGAIELIAAAHRRGRARVRAADRRADPAPGPERDRRGPIRDGDRTMTSRSPASSASCIRDWSRRGTSGRGACRRRAVGRGPVRRRAAGRRGACRSRTSSRSSAT